MSTSSPPQRSETPLTGTKNSTESASDPSLDLSDLHKINKALKAGLISLERAKKLTVALRAEKFDPFVHEPGADALVRARERMRVNPSLVMTEARPELERFLNIQAMYERGDISLNKARELAGMPVVEDLSDVAFASTTVRLETWEGDVMNVPIPQDIAQNETDADLYALKQFYQRAIETGRIAEDVEMGLWKELPSDKVPEALAIEKAAIDAVMKQAHNTPTPSPSTPGTTLPSMETRKARSSSLTNRDLSDLEIGPASSCVSPNETDGSS